MTLPVPVLSRSLHDRAAMHRKDQAFLDRAWADPASRVLMLSADARVQATDRLRWTSPQQVPAEGVRLYLGEHRGVAYLALLCKETISRPDGQWNGLRELAVLLDELDVGLLTAAVALQAWHRTHSHCPRCGNATEPVDGGWVRRCVADGSDHFPRTDPAVIMLVTDDEDRCLLGRNAAWPAGRFSILAGFVEAGESAEAAVAREVAEEVGIAITDVRYAASQPHPFPASLMLGFTARVTGDPTLRVDADEIADAGWFTRAQVRLAQRGGADFFAESDDAPTNLRALPPGMSIARQLIDDWVDQDRTARGDEQP